MLLNTMIATSTKIIKPKPPPSAPIIIGSMLGVTTSNPCNVKVISIGAVLKIPSLLIAPPITVATNVAVPFHH